MRCPSCGANANGAVCEYCGTRMPAERIETQSIHADHVVVNNYYYNESPEGAGATARPDNVSVGFTPAVSSKSRLVALLLWFFLGIFGAHRFYCGRYLLGVVYLLTLGLFGIGWFVDLVLILLGRMRDRNGLAVENW